MSDINDVIRRSRQKGKFSERKEFTISTERAFEKIQKFALQSPEHYILEIIQGAVANGARFIDLKIGKSESRIAWTGGLFLFDQLQQVFDYLLADKSDQSIVAIRQIALGISGMLSLKPSCIIIESGDGTLEGTSRFEYFQKQ